MTAYVVLTRLHTSDPAELATYSQKAAKARAGHALTPLAAYGPWRRHYPHVTCGLKRGFTYYKHQDGQRFVARADRRNELLVAASPGDEVSDTHWLRADVDQFLMQEAVSLGATVHTD